MRETTLYTHQRVEYEVKMSRGVPEFHSLLVTVILIVEECSMRCDQSEVYSFYPNNNSEPVNEPTRPLFRRGIVLTMTSPDELDCPDNGLP